MLKTPMIAPAAICLACLLAAGQAHAQTAYNQAVLADNPILYWTFDEAVNSSPASSLVNNTAFNQLLPVGTATRGASTVTPGGAFLGRAARFDGSATGRFAAADLFGPGATAGTGVVDPNFDFIGSQVWAAEFWFKPEATGAQYLMESGVAGTNLNNPSFIYGFNGTAAGDPELELFEGFGGTGRTGAGPVDANKWHHVIMAFYGNNSGFQTNLREIYVDGVLTQDTTSPFSSGFVLDDFALGNAIAPNNAPLTGYIDEFALYDLGVFATFAQRQAFVAQLVDHAAVPEPASIALWSIIGMAALGVAVHRRRRGR